MLDIITTILILLLIIIGIISFVLDIVSAIYRMRTDRKINKIVEELNLSSKNDNQ